MIYNETLYMIKIDKEIIGMKIPKIEYEIFIKMYLEIILN